MKIILNEIEDINSKGVYLIRNTLNQKVYVGSTISSFKTRLREHKRKLKSGTHHNSHLQSSVNKYGIDSFEFLIIEIIKESSLIRNKESYYIDLYKSSNDDFGYNISNETLKPPINQQIKDKISATIKRKLSEDDKYIENHKKAREKRKGIPSWNAGVKCDNISNTRKEMFGDIEVYDINMKYIRTFDNCIEIEKFAKSELNDLPIINSKKGGHIVSQNIHRAIRNNKSYKGLYFKKVPRGTIYTNE